jgi:hypothetical protein
MGGAHPPSRQEDFAMRLLPALALSAGLALGACSHPDGSTDWGSTAALGLGTAALVGLVAVAANSNNDDRYRDRRTHRRHGGWQHDRYAHRDPYGYRDHRRW